MAAGLPIVTTDTGGTAELLNGNGIVVEKGDSKSITEALDSYREDETRRKQHGRRSRELAEKMSWESVADQYESVYRRIC